MPVRSSRIPSRVSRGVPNNVQRLREEQLLTKAELARRARISALTLSRIEGGAECRVDTKRKIILALGMQPSDRAKVFGNESGRGPRRRG